MDWKKTLTSGGKIAVKQLGPVAIGLVAKYGGEIVENHKNLIKIPDLKDVHIDEALGILNELNLTPTSAIANPSIGYADESENEVMYSEPRFGTRVSPGSTVKVYYLTNEVIDKSKKLLGTVIREFKVPEVIGLNIFEAREDLEALGLKVTEKLEKPNIKFVGKEDGQVIRVTSPNDHKIGSKLKTGDRVWLYYVNEEVILESMSIKDKKDKNKKEMIDKFGKITQEALKEINTGTVGTHHNITQNIKNPFKKKKAILDESVE